jgi:tetratricopeptide (TPR) repeat protein
MQSQKTLLKKMGDLLRERREQMGWSLAKAAEESGLSKTMCYRLEQGDILTNESNYRWYCEVLGLDFDELCQQIQGNDLLKQELAWIETDIDLARGKGLEQSIQQLKDLNVPSNHPYIQVIEYLKGKAYFYAKKYDKSEKALRRAINIADRHIEEYGYLNIMTSAYNVLSNVFYQAWHQYDRALELADEAVALFVQEGERQIEFYMSFVNKLVFLDKLKRLAEAEKHIQFLRENLHKIYKADTQAAICELIARIQTKNKQYIEAREAIQMGIDIARRNNLPHRASDLSIEWGNIHVETGKPEQAERAYFRALNYYATIRVYNALGKLYLKAKDLGKARDAFAKSLEYNQDETAPDYIDALIGMGKVLILQNQKSEAIIYLEKAESLTTMKDKLKDIYWLLIECYGTNSPKGSYYWDKLKRVQMEGILN